MVLALLGGFLAATVFIYYGLGKVAARLNRNRWPRMELPERRPDHIYDDEEVPKPAPADSRPGVLNDGRTAL